jgi:signal transduction histidine kinase
VSAPVRERTSAGTVENAEGGQIIGRLRIATSQAAVQAIIARLIFWSLVASVVVLGASLYFVVRGSRRVTDPLLAIVQTMRAAGQGTDRPRAALVGAEEIVTIARVYNARMDDIDEQAAQTDAIVERRTEQLRVATDAARAAVLSKNAFMTTVSHEMKTPLHVIEANTRDVMNELEFIAGAEQARGYLGVILNQARELALRLSQILALARADAGSYQVVRGEFELADFAQDLRERAAPLARKNRNKLEVQTAGGRAYTDRDMVLLVATNLVVNACKFTQSGHVRVNVCRVDKVLELEVVDNGPGISHELQQVIWDEFRQGDNGEGRRFGGFGLGLAIVRRFCQMLGGTVTLESEQGRGTRVVARIPAVAD